MRGVVQRVQWAQVVVAGSTVGKIAQGLCVFVGVDKTDVSADAEALAEKVVGLRIFEDASGRMNESLLERGGALLAISQFTLLADARRGRRPSFTAAMEPDQANVLFERFCAAVRGHGVGVEQGRFRAHMEVSLLNDGPVTLLLDTKKSF